MRPTVLVTGANGLLGSRLLNLFAAQYDWQNLDLNGSPAVDITNWSSLAAAVPHPSPATHLVHLAAYTDVTGAWLQNGDKSGLAYQINVEGTRNIVRLCQSRQLHLIHVSTAYVFDGAKSTPYLETDATGAIDWYGKTKELAEQVVTESPIPSTILRIDNPFRIDQQGRLDIVGRMVKSLVSDSLPPQFGDSYVGPTVIEDFCQMIDWVIRTNSTGVFHASSGEVWTPLQLAQEINHRLGDLSDVQQSSVYHYLLRATRPYLLNSSLNSSRLRSMVEFPLLTVQQALDQIDWLAARTHATAL